MSISESLNAYSTDELLEELARRKKVEATVPKLIEIPDLSTLISQAKDIVQEVVDGTWHEDNDDAHYMYEAVMEALYGEKFWNWFNDNTE